MEDLVPGGLLQAAQRFLIECQIPIDNLITLNADQVGMWVGFIPVIAIAAITKAQFQDLPHFLEQGDSLVDRSKAGHGEIELDLVINLLNTGVPGAGSQDLEHRHALRGKAVPAVSQSLGDFIQADVSLGHFYPCPVSTNKIDEQGLIGK
jgi:hypothetical protein